MIVANPRGKALLFWKDFEWVGDEIPVGWLPSEIGEPARAIRWVRVGSEALSEPFFYQTVRSLRQNHSVECETDFACLERIAEQFPATAPAGIIIHMSRCGSTLVANALRKTEGTVVASEAVAVEKMLVWAGAQSDYWVKTASRYLPLIVTLFASYQGLGPRRLVLKSSNAGIYSMSMIRSLWPDVPCLILIRNPIEVLVSNVQKQPKWLVERTMVPALRHEQFQHEILQANAVDFCAWTIGNFCRKALQVIDSKCHVLDYTGLAVEEVAKVAEEFGLSLTENSKLAFQESFRRNAKEPSREFYFDSDEKQLAAGESIRASAAKWIQEPYAKLLALAQGDYTHRRDQHEPLA